MVDFETFSGMIKLNFHAFTAFKRVKFEKSNLASTGFELYAKKKGYIEGRDKEENLGWKG